MLTAAGIPCKDFGIARDEHVELTTKLENALHECDLVVTTGSVSMGDRDILRDVLQQKFKATIHFARRVSNAEISYVHGGTTDLLVF